VLARDRAGMFQGEHSQATARELTALALPRGSMKRSVFASAGPPAWRNGALRVAGMYARVLAALEAALSCAGCSSPPPPSAIVASPDAGVGVTDAGAGFVATALGCGSAGTQSVIAVSGAKIGVASLASTSTTQVCTISPLSPTQSSQVPVWNVCYAESKPDGSFSSEVVTSQPYTTPTGVGLAFDSTGNPGIAFTGVGATPAAERCGANDAFLTIGTAGTFGAPVQVSNGSQSDGLVAAQAGNCSQNVCNSGDVTGWWPALVFDPSDRPLIAYRDVHFGFAVDDLTATSDLEFAEGNGGVYSVLTIDVSRGGGWYNRVAMTPAGLAAVLHFSTGAMPGVYLNRAATLGNLGDQEADGGWSSELIFSGQVGPQLGFGINAQGVFGVAYFDATSLLLAYVESPDGSTWTEPLTVDAYGLTGQYPSLAFDSNGEPAIAYYRCSASHANTQCDEMADGLYLARRTGGAWKTVAVHSDPNTYDGLYPALAFVGDKAVVAFQVISYDAVSAISSSTWWVAEEQ